MKRQAKHKPEAGSCGCSSSGCGDGIERRDFIKTVALGAAAAMAPSLPAAAGPFEPSDFEKMIPADKKLDPAWVESLLARGTPTVYRGAELEKIGMPVGGICAGQLYLGGDGKLWHWDIFNRALHTGEAHYAKPPKPSAPLDQGFALKITAAGKTQVRSLDHTGFSNISFRGEYPIGRIEYRDAASSVAVSLEAFSPFIPLNPEDSALPATILQFTVKNAGNQPVEAELAGWLENAVCLYSAYPGSCTRQNRIDRRSRRTLLDCSAVANRLPSRAGIVFEDFQKGKSDRPSGKPGEQPDFGTLGLALLEPAETDAAMAAVPEGHLPETIFLAAGEGATGSASASPKALAGPVTPCESRPVGQKLVGALRRKLSLAPGQSSAVTFVLTWHFPNLRIKDGGRHYAQRFASAGEVADYVTVNFERLAGQTRLWRDTWYDSSLPYWLLDRTFVNTSILATSTCHWFKSGRFYGWEGVGCCEGTCTHVWHYAHAVARIFPQLERDLRERTDFGLAQNPATGVINHRGEGAGLAVDGQAGCILRAYREHQMSADGSFLNKLWPKIKLAMQCLIRLDDGEGILEGPQHNTLDQPWFGKVAWLSSLYLAAARACEEMAKEVGDEPFARQVRAIADRGTRNIDRELFNGEYYVHVPDKDHVRSVGSHNGCEIDQVFGQSWAYQVGLGRILPEDHVKKALASLWKYNFTPDVGAYRAAHKPGRWYAMAGEGGLIMCTWPRGEGARVAKGFDYYFNECMTGFEYQVAWHMIWEGMVKEGLAIARAIHDRYHASRRNPWNEVECGDHYARAMASYGVFLAACGYEYHGPKGYLGFAPRLAPDNFRAALTTAEGWGTFAQRREGGVRTASVEIRWGRLRLRTLALAEGAKPTDVHVKLGGAPLACRHRVEGGRLIVALAVEAVIETGQKLEVTIG